MTEVLAAHPSSAGLLLDFDGSLAPIVVDPAVAAAPPDTLAVLERIVGRIPLVAIVSGRPLDFLARAVPIPGVELVGQYGLERRVGGTTAIEPAALAYRDAVATAASEAERRWPDLLVERKGEIAVTLHWRAVGDVGAPVVSEIDALGAGLGLAVYPTRMARELRPPIAVDKGSAVRSLLADAPGATRAAFAGDDRGDLPAFDALDALAERGRLDGAVRIAVRSPEVPGELLERADLVVDGPAGLFEWLRALAEALGGELSP
ncbi:MAG: trehalose 6-phosphate phosphatase [Actinomycetota bacterium]|nr:trehalose 6-phosphate phosphatase [Actinomycetota bacterium]